MTAADLRLLAVRSALASTLLPEATMAHAVIDLGRCRSHNSASVLRNQ
jgi:hypothetical protein